MAGVKDIGYTALREKREGLGWSRERPAKEAGVNPDCVRFLENGKRKSPRPETKRKIAKALNCQPRDIFVDSNLTA